MPANTSKALDTPLEQTEAGGNKKCSVCSKFKDKDAFSSKQWGSKAHSRKCSACIEQGAASPSPATAAASPAAPQNNTAEKSMEQAAKGELPDVLSLADFVMHLATARAQYHKNTELPDEAVCRHMLTTRVPGLPLSRVKIGKSSVPGAGDGLLATRDIEVGELITLYPADAVLMWEDETHDVHKKVTCFFSKHIPDKERNLQRALTEWRGCEVPCHATMSIVGDPGRRGDMAYVAHVANDGASCDSEEGVEEYERVSAERENAELMPLKVEEKDHKGNQMVLHFALVAAKAIKAGEEVLVTYGFRYWELKAKGLFHCPQDAKAGKASK
mmetsp:Transcript_9846/g.24081  ORF Transcript_9846/g.24081 Transcript_9846/m.24081 type:complete len:329 (-) Transcript_9846:223-1209(-)